MTSGGKTYFYLTYAEGDPVNRIDPSGTLSVVDVFSFADSALGVRDAIRAGLSGDTGALWSMVGGAAAGLITETPASSHSDSSQFPQQGRLTYWDRQSVPLPHTTSVKRSANSNERRWTTKGGDHE
ncbi:hypothetical protein [Streptomyces sp. NPDC096934]|uniref:hypothetical protein n=1 Tax=Streptomyces sp. NPDC096934 TaxID=3155551 RepID=UPI003322AE97